MAKGRLRIGISGWTYGPWRGSFYPKGLPQRRELAYAAERLDAIEINGTFYGLQKPKAYAAWASAVPDDFIFAIKGSRYITHYLRLGEVEIPLANFFAQGLLRLGPKLGPILWQLPARFHFDPARLERFLRLLPANTEAAATLARRHDERLVGRDWTETDARRPLRHALEVRHASFAVPEFVELLREHNCALVVSDAVGWPLLTEATADLVYCRLHGSEELYTSGYDEPALDRWAAWIREWLTGREPAHRPRIEGARPAAPRPRDVFVFFDNDRKVRAPVDAQALRARFGLKTPAAADA